MEVMYVSIEVLTTLGSFVGLLAAVVSGFGWLIRRTDAQLQHVAARLEGRMDRLEEHIGRVERELTEVKIAVARLEGPIPRLVTAR